MPHLPVIVGMGGLGPAGRTSGHHAYRRLVLDVLSDEQRTTTVRSLRSLLATDAAGTVDDDELLGGTLVRALGPEHFDTERVPFTQRDEQGVLREASMEFPARAAGQLPTGVDPGDFYNSRNHPRGLQLAVYGASDALSSLGMSWDDVVGQVAPDEIACFAGAAIAQMDDCGFGGLLQSRLTGRRTSPKQLPLGLGEMPADFVNAYVLGNFGTTGHNMGACSTFLYNLQLASDAIRSGRARVAVAGAAEAPLVVDVLAGLFAMGALAKDDALRAVQGLAAGQTPDHRSACRPFGENCGMVPGESSQYAILFSEDLVLETGANVLGAVGGAYTNADGPKKSITSPGVGNYISLARCVAEAAAIVGDDVLPGRSYIHAHGTGTPQNRVTESHILSSVSRAFGLGSWAVTAVKAHLGHSMASAAGDQLAAALGFWAEGWIPGITTTPELADDVVTDGLDFVLDHREVDPESMLVTFLNAKGFGGNNASASILSPAATIDLMRDLRGTGPLDAWRHRNEDVERAAREADATHLDGSFAPTYRFGEGVLDGSHVRISRDELTLEGQARPVSLRLPDPFRGGGAGR